MLKRFENLGTALSRNESKKVVGGNYTVLMVDLGDLAGDEGSCSGSCDVGKTSGTCRTASNNLCYCSNGMGSC